jgi:hypothetical protein
MNKKASQERNNALRFIILMGIVSLLGDVVYEGARGVTGPYLALLGASATMVGLIGGLGEFIGYALRLFSGFIADRTKAYWLFTFIGYGLLIAIPLLAFTNSWQVAALLIVLERVGKAFRSPARDTILSYATKEVGRGFGFGLHEALDQIGAIIGPLIFSVILFAGGNYRTGFSVLWIPALMVIGILRIAKNRLPHPEKLESEQEAGAKNNPIFSKIFILYSLFTFFAVAGFANFPLISYHLKIKAIVSDVQIPALFALAMGVDAININVKAVNDRGKEQKRLSRSTRFVISFTIAKNITAEPGERIIYVRIMTPDGNVLTKNPSDTFPFENGNLQYSIKRIIEYGGEEMPVTVYWNIEEYLMPGTYKVDIFADGNHIGSHSFTMQE